MNDTIAALGLALGTAFTAGLNLYATVAALGLAAQAGAIQLPPDLQVLAHPGVITLALVLYVVEFFADKVPYVDSAWDAVHTFIRVPAGAILAARAFGPVSPPLELAAVLAGGSMALAAHATKATTRLALNASPEPFSNWVASVAEDATALVGVWLVFNHPLLMLGFLAAFVIGVAWMAPKVWRGLRSLFRRLGGRDDGSGASRQSRAPEGTGEAPSGASSKEG
ncbi:MAG: DUF4126 domain-containing protein [Deltaproteobacteria bacterium]|nr:DUF4126 domain-containing protein [Deltaproteobacteria bacterium]